jgi:hypothetical protein
MAQPPKSVRWRTQFGVPQGAACRAAPTAAFVSRNYAIPGDMIALVTQECAQTPVNVRSGLTTFKSRRSKLIGEIEPGSSRGGGIAYGVIDDTGFNCLADQRSSACGSGAKRWNYHHSAAVEGKWRTELQCLGSPTGIQRYIERSARRGADTCPRIRMISYLVSMRRNSSAMDDARER